MGRLAQMTASGVLVLCLALAGCGSSSSSSTSAKSTSQTGSAQSTGPSGGTGQTASTQTTGTSASTQQPATSRTEKHVPIVSLKLTSPSFKLGGTIPARYTCDGTNLSPGLHWGAIPKHTAELAVYIDAVESNGGKVQNSWAVLGLPPTLRGLAPGRLPAEAIVGRNSYGQTHYTLCPQKGSGLQRYVVAVYTLPHRIAAQPGFSAEAFFEKIINAAALSGLTGFAYERH